MNQTAGEIINWIAHNYVNEDGEPVLLPLELVRELDAVLVGAVRGAD